MLKRIGQLEPAPPWGLFVAFNTAFVPLVAVVAGTMIAYTLIAEPVYMVTLVAWLVGSTLTIIYVRVSRQTSEDRAALRLGTLSSRLLIFLLLGVGMAIVVDVVLLAITGQFLPTPELTALYANRAALNPVIWVVTAVFMLVFQPVADELVFRGVFFPVARHLLGAWGGLVASAMVYALFHYLIYPPVVSVADAAATGSTITIGYAVVSLLAGLILGTIRANTGSTTAAIAAHAGFGLFALLKLIVL